MLKESEFLDRPEVTSLPPDLSEAALYEQRFESRGTDEIRLADVWLVLVRRRLIIAGVLLVSMAFGFIQAFLKTSLYEYTTIIEVGTRYADGRNEFGGRVEFIEPVETARAKVAGGYIAQVLQAHIKDSNDTSRYEIKAEVPKNSQVLILKSRGTAESEPIYVALHSAIVDRLRLDHLRVQHMLRKDLEFRLEMQQRSLAELREQAGLFDAQLKRFEGKRELPVRELSYLTNLRLADNRRAQSEMIRLIDSVRAQLANIRETSAVVSPMRSLSPVSLGKEMTIVLSALVGLFLGVVVAFFVDFAARARAGAAQQGPAT